jgi:hypothetical protein
MNRIGRTLVVVGAILAALTPTALARIQPQEGDSPQVDTAPTVVSYQGRVTVSGVPHNGTGYFKFAVVDSNGTASYWSNDGSSIGGSEPVNDVALSMSGGLFNVLLGDTSLPGMSQPLPAAAFSAPNRYLRVWFATAAGGPYTQLAPDRRVGATPYALNAETLDGQDASAFAPAAHDHFGQTWSGNSTTGLTVNNAGSGGLNASGTTYGVTGLADSTLGYGVYGYATATDGFTYGVIGENLATTGGGVNGWAGAGSGSVHGVLGESQSTAGTGVGGYAHAGSGTTYGVYGWSASSNGYGVYGSALSTGVYGSAGAASGYTFGVWGQSASTDGRGVVGYATTTSSGFPIGVHGRSDSPSGYGVLGEVTATSGTTNGVQGTSYSPAGRGVYGEATATSGTNYGVYGLSQSTAGYGVYGYASDTSGSNVGVFGQSESTNGRGVYGLAGGPTGVTVGVIGLASSTSGYGVYSIGNFGATGTKAAIVETQDYGWRHLYAMESPDNWFEDFGQAQLVDGKATVTIEPVFAQTVNLAQPYHVFAMPLGAYCPLYVAEQTPTSFTVRVDGGQACEAGFHYRIIARRLGYEDLRLGPAQDPATLAPIIPTMEALPEPRGR